MITAETLRALSPQANAQRLTLYAPALEAARAAYGIDTPRRLAHFMAQLAHESDNFRALVENLNYSAQGLYNTFPRRIGSLANAQALVAREDKKSAIAEAIYGNRPELGNVNPGDGYRYIGRGFIMITGRANYTRYGELTALPLVDQPEKLEEPETAARASAAFWQAKNLNALADDNDLTGITRIINGGTNGLDHRKALYERAKQVWPEPVLPPSFPGHTPLSTYFTLEELTQSDIAERNGIDNTPTPEHLANLRDTAQRMDQVRTLLGQPVIVRSGYRSVALNTRIGGARSSAHLSGRAVDFVSQRFGTPLDICRRIMASDIVFDQLIYEGTWVHIGFSDTPRRQALKADFSRTPTLYTPLVF
ncbi:MAG: D-Ala-D-Ala carboxypeptidase family metallohydrolase [Asticcacaulis sp.]